jgi:hypothetical protein
MKKKIFDFLTNFWDKVQCRLRLFCDNSSPKKRLTIVLAITGILSIVSIYSLISSIYNIGEQDKKKDFMELQHIQFLELQTTDNEQLIINHFNTEEYEY